MTGDPPYGIFIGNGKPATQTPMRPAGLEVDAQGNVYISDTGNARIYRVTPDGTLFSIAGIGRDYWDAPVDITYDMVSPDAFPATRTLLTTPERIALATDGTLYSIERQIGQVRKIGPEGVVSTTVGTFVNPTNIDGVQGTKVRLYNPTGIAADAAGNLFIAEAGNHKIRKVNTNGIITTVAGTGEAGFGGDGGDARKALLQTPQDVAVDSAGNLYVADMGNHRIRKLTPGADGAYTISTLAGKGGPGDGGAGGFSGDGGPAVDASLKSPAGLALDDAGNLYIADSGNHRVRKILGAAAPTPVSAQPNRSAEPPVPPMTTFEYASFPSADSLWLHAHSKVANDRLRLTPGEPGRVGAAYHGSKVMLANGFETTFRLQLSNLSNLPPFPPGGDGMTFLVHNSNGGFLGDLGHALGYANFSGGTFGLGGIPNAVAVEFDTWKNDNMGDPNDLHVSVHNTRSGGLNAHEQYSLGWTLAIPNLKDQNVHTVKIRYVPGILSVFIDNPDHPTLRVPLDLSTALVLDEGAGWVGFTAASGGAFEQHDLLSWSFSNAPGPEAPSQTTGDVNNDGARDIRDAVETLQYIVGLKAFTSESKLLPDVNADGAVNVLDVQLMLLNLVFH